MQCAAVSTNLSLIKLPLQTHSIWLLWWYPIKAMCGYSPQGTSSPSNDSNLVAGTAHLCILMVSFGSNDDWVSLSVKALYSSHASKIVWDVWEILPHTISYPKQFFFEHSRLAQISQFWQLHVVRQVQDTDLLVPMVWHHQRWSSNARKVFWSLVVLESLLQNALQATGSEKGKMLALVICKPDWSLEQLKNTITWEIKRPKTSSWSFTGWDLTENDSEIKSLRTKRKHWMEQTDNSFDLWHKLMQKLSLFNTTILIKHFKPCHLLRTLLPRQIPLPSLSP